MGDVNGIPVWILYHDLLTGRKAFAGPYDNDDSRLKADEKRLKLADTVTDVKRVRARSIAPWMPTLRLTGPGRLGCPGAEVRKADGIVRVVADWDAVVRAFPGQLVEATASDGEEFCGEVTSVDVAGRLIWIDVD